MLGYFTSEGQGSSDLLLGEVTEQLRSKGVALAGAVQRNVERDPDRKCDMELHLLSGAPAIRISQDLGRDASGCRLDADGLERAVGLVDASLAETPELLIVNKFGKQEVDGHGFRPVIGRAVVSGIPVLTAVSSGHLEGFIEFAGEMAEQLPAEPSAILSWCMRRMGEAGPDEVTG